VLAPTDLTLGLLNRYVLSLARYDLDYDVRDRARMLNTLLSRLVTRLNDETALVQGGVVLRKEQVQLILFNGKANAVEATSRMGATNLIVYILLTQNLILSI